MTNTFVVEESAVIDAPPTVVYALLADYTGPHQAILPPDTFLACRVESGGVGDGTIIDVQVELLGARRSYRAAITEPEPGRVLVETSLVDGMQTTFRVEPIDGGQRSQVTFNTRMPGSGGVRGWFERRIVPPALRRVYVEELGRLNQAVTQPG